MPYEGRRRRRRSHSKEYSKPKPSGAGWFVAALFVIALLAILYSVMKSDGGKNSGVSSDVDRYGRKVSQ